VASHLCAELACIRSPCRSTFTTPRPSSTFAAMAAKATRESVTQQALLDELKAAAEKLGLQVREERLLREVGYRVRSGRCRLREDEIIFLERGLPASAQIDVLIDELANRSLDDIYLSPAARALLEKVATRNVLCDDGHEAHGG